METEAYPQGAPLAPAEAAATSGDITAGGNTSGDGGEPVPELPLFSCKEAYVYRVPPASTVGHRAEVWDVNNWLATVALRVVQLDDDAFVRLLDAKTGACCSLVAALAGPLCA